MKLTCSLRTVNLGLVLLLILLMCTQLGFVVPVGTAELPISLADVVLALALFGVGLSFIARRARGTRLPPLQALAVVAVAVVALARTKGGKMAAAKEVVQYVEYFLVAYFVFVNVAQTSDLKLLLAAFAVATAGVVLWGGVHYFTCDSSLDVRAGFANRNLLGAFLAIALPMLYGLALYTPRWRWRIVLLAVVVLGLAVDLSGGAVLVTLVVLGLLSALRGQRALVPYLVLLVVAALVAPRVRLRPYHTNTLFSSVAITVDDNFLLNDPRMLERAEELFRPTKEIILDHSGERVVPPSRPLDARRLLELLANRRPPTPEEDELLGEVMEAIERDVAPAQRQGPLDRPQLAVRYQRWHAAITCARDQWRRPLDALFGAGFVPYHEAIKRFMTDRLQYRTDEPEVFNVAAPEAGTFNAWLQTLVLMGLLGFLALAWLVGTFLYRAERLFRAAHGELARGVSLGAVGSVVGFALVSLFTETIVRGIAIPFVFVLATVAIAERIVYGEPEESIEQLTRYD